MKLSALPPRARVPSPVWVLALATALVLAAFGLAVQHRVDAAVHDTYQHRLARLLTLQHRLNEQVLRAHAGLVGSYDPIVRTMRELRDVHRELSVVPAFVGAAGQRDIAARLERSRAVLAAQEELVERFKSQNAILLNSLRYFPVAASELAAEMANEPDADREASQLREALRDVLRVAVFPTEEAIAETTAHLASIQPSGPHAAAVQLLLRHARIITLERPAVDALLGDILEQPGESAALELGARDAGVALEAGVYAALLGPSYETPAEIRWLAGAGADAVGMSTALEAVAARASGARVCGISLITNQAAGISPTPLAHEEVVAAGAAAAARFSAVLERALPHLCAAR